MHGDLCAVEQTTDFQEGALFAQDEFGWLIDTSNSRPNTIEWLEQNRTLLDKRLNEKGVVLLRGTNFNTIADFDAFISALGEKLSYKYRSTPRSELQGKVFTSTNYPATETIPLHNENAFSTRYPSKIIFGCHVAPETGGATTLADSYLVYNLIPVEIKEKFVRLGVKYVRNMGVGFDLHWHEVFQTEDKNFVQQMCTELGLSFSWQGGILRTEQTLPAIKQVPGSELNVWFNQAHLFHYSSIPNDISTWLLGMFGEEGLPRNAYYGDGSPIEIEVLTVISQIYEQCLRSFSWEQRDLLIIDNIRVAHGRAPFTGDRVILTGMLK
jgi:alpha-ketoglutarate-dependent taurine dioxygenase